MERRSCEPKGKKSKVTGNGLLTVQKLVSRVPIVVKKVNKSTLCRSVPEQVIHMFRPNQTITNSFFEADRVMGETLFDGRGKETEFNSFANSEVRGRKGAARALNEQRNSFALDPPVLNSLDVDTPAAASHTPQGSPVSQKNTVWRSAYMHNDSSFCSRNMKEVAARQRKKSLHTLLEQDSGHTSTNQCDTLDLGLRPELNAQVSKKRMA